MISVMPSLLFPFYQLIRREITYKVALNADFLPTLAAGFVRRADLNRFHKRPQSIRRQFFQFRVFVYPLDELV